MIDNSEFSQCTNIIELSNEEIIRIPTDSPVDTFCNYHIEFDANIPSKYNKKIPTNIQYTYVGSTTKSKNVKFIVPDLEPNSIKTLNGDGILIAENFDEETKEKVPIVKIIGTFANGIPQGIFRVVFRENIMYVGILNDRFQKSGFGHILRFQYNLKMQIESRLYSLFSCDDLDQEIKIESPSATIVTHAVSNIIRDSITITIHSEKFVYRTKKIVLPIENQVIHGTADVEFIRDDLKGEITYFEGQCKRYQIKMNVGATITCFDTNVYTYFDPRGPCNVVFPDNLNLSGILDTGYRHYIYSYRVANAAGMIDLFPGTVIEKCSLNSQCAIHGIVYYKYNHTQERFIVIYENNFVFFRKFVQFFD
jgi:hypothetical protein